MGCYKFTVYFFAPPLACLAIGARALPLVAAPAGPSCSAAQCHSDAIRQARVTQMRRQAQSMPSSEHLQIKVLSNWHTQCLLVQCQKARVRKLKSCRTLYKESEMTHAEIAANARAPYARRIAEDTRIIEILVFALRDILEFDSLDYSEHIRGMQNLARNALAKVTP